MDFSNTRKLIEKAVLDGAFPCAAYAIGNRNGLFERGFLGSRALYPQSEPLLENTLFDMASLSKLISTTMVALKAIESGRLCLDDQLSAFFDACYDKGYITIGQLMTHTSGIAAYIPLYSMGIDKSLAVDVILKEPFAYQTGTKAVYSCMGFILLGKILETVYNKPLDILAKELIFTPLEMETACYCPSTQNVAATEYSHAESRYICGEVHDENARFLGGVSGNAGVFCSLDDMILFAKMLANRGKGFISSAMFEAAVKNYTVGMEESRGLGFLLTGENKTFGGDLFSDGSYGHTGFTGTSVMVDNQTGMYVVLLTNRVHFGRENDKIIRFRRRFHNSVFGGLL